PLAAVRGAIQVIGSRMPPGSRDLPVVTEIVTRIDALDALLKDLLLFARTPQPRLATLDLGLLARATASFLAGDPLLANLHVEMRGTTGPIHGDADLLRIVLQNLLINAAQAMEGQGTITLTFGSDDRGHWVSVADHGPGIAAEAKQNLFRPFFTTKA